MQHSEKLLWARTKSRSRRLGEWGEQQQSRGWAEKSKPGEQKGTRDVEAEVVVRGRKQVGCPGNRQGRQNEDRQGRQRAIRQGNNAGKSCMDAEEQSGTE
ncbi:hypothetical protein D4764_16G0000950 [Takifugu flavidus]|uniref:Uncharacterized protein n=1 Tax=Takifugu flavidus TaxID=433684 RepID=A0A5C6NXQ0_9TELE|nr:hypothetical protein D4764_16G0000950 [Takifugu flavidus]